MANQQTRRQQAEAKIAAIRATLPHQPATTTAQVLENAIAFLKGGRGNWAKGYEFNMEDGSACLIGALYIANGGRISFVNASEPLVWFAPLSQRTPEDRPLLQAQRLVKEATGDPNASISAFNDLRARSKTQVINVLKKALNQARKEA